MKITATAEPKQHKWKMQDGDEATIGCLSLLWNSANLILCAWVATLFWNWFLLPVFPDLQQSINIYQALGLMFCVSLLRRGVITAPCPPRDKQFDVAYAFASTFRI